MPQPTAGDVHVSRPLTNISVAYIQSADRFIARKVFPTLPVDKQGDEFWVYRKEDWFRIVARKRADGAESAGGGYELGTDNYFADVIAFHKDVSDRQRRNQDQGLNLDRDASRFTSRQLLLESEFNWASQYFTTGVWGNEETGVSGAPAAGQFQQWNEAGSTPLEDVDDWKLLIESTTGIEANTMVVSPYVHRALRNNAEVLDRIKYTQRGQITMDLMAAMFEVDNYYVARAVQNTSAEGNATQNYDYIMGKNVLLTYSTPTPGLQEPTGGYTFVWSGIDGGIGGGGEEGVSISQFRMDSKKSDRVEGEFAYDQKLVAPDLGVFGLDAVA